MQTIVLVIHVMLAIALCGVVLLQRSEGGGLGMGGGGASGGLGLMSGRTTANLLTRTTAILAGSFMATSILLAVLSGGSCSAQCNTTPHTASATLDNTACHWPKLKQWITATRAYRI